MVSSPDRERRRPGRDWVRCRGSPPSTPRRCAGRADARKAPRRRAAGRPTIRRSRAPCAARGRPWDRPRPSGGPRRHGADERGDRLALVGAEALEVAPELQDLAVVTALGEDALLGAEEERD